MFYKSYCSVTRSGELDLTLSAVSFEEAKEIFMRWKECMESKGVRMNVEKTKVVISGAGEGLVVKSGKVALSNK